jgi:hypothetical protein
MEALVASWTRFRYRTDLTTTSNNQETATNSFGRSAKPLCVGSIPTRASKFFKFRNGTPGYLVLDSFLLGCEWDVKVVISACYRIYKECPGKYWRLLR